MNIDIYHGRSREIDFNILADSDIVLTTYFVVSAEALDDSSPLNRIEWFRIVLDEGKKTLSLAMFV